MKMWMIVEDRDLAHVILDTSGEKPCDAREVEVTLAPDARWVDADNEDATIWLEKDNAYLVMNRADFDFDGDFDRSGFPIPTPVVVLDAAEYGRCLGRG